MTNGTKCEIRTAGGAVFCGEVHGSGGTVRGENGLNRIRRAIKRAARGRETGLYEPAPAHLCVYVNGVRTSVDIRGASVLVIK